MQKSSKWHPNEYDVRLFVSHSVCGWKVIHLHSAYGWKVIHVPLVERVADVNGADYVLELAGGHRLSKLASVHRLVLITVGAPRLWPRLWGWATSFWPRLWGWATSFWPKLWGWATKLLEWTPKGKEEEEEEAAAPDFRTCSDTRSIRRVGGGTKQ